MKSKERTKSECLFECFCKQNHIAYTRLSEGNSKQPDYEIEISEPKVVVEVKEFAQNEEDKQEDNTLKETGSYSGRDNPDCVAKRIRQKIEDASSQFRSYFINNKLSPALLVLFDNASPRKQYVDPYIIQIAMYGWEQAIISVPHDKNSLPYLVNMGFADRNNKSFRGDKNDLVSAIVVLNECNSNSQDEKYLSLCFYHNQYAKINFPIHLWNRENIHHYMLENKVAGHPQNWIDVKMTETVR